jgi:hypothetical protein
MTKSEKQSWEQERAKGYDHFLLHSVLRAGLPFGIVVTLANVVVPFFTHHPMRPVWELLVGFGFLVLAFGAFMGANTWRRNERDYHQPTEDDHVA